MYLFRVDLSDPLVLCLWTNYSAVLNYARVLSRVSPVIYVSGASVFAQFAVCISVKGIIHGTWNVLGTPTVHLGRASPEDLCSRFRVSALRLNSYRMTGTFRLGIGADLWTCHPPHWLCIYGPSCQMYTGSLTLPSTLFSNFASRPS